MGFRPTKSQSILSNNVGKYIGLLYSEPVDGSAVDEPTISTTTGYTRGIVQGWNTTKSRQIANNAIIFMFECLDDLGTFSHFGCFSSASVTEPDYTGELVGTVTVNKGYVPLIRRCEMIIGLDKDELDTSY